METLNGKTTRTGIFHYTREYTRENKLQHSSLWVHHPHRVLASAVSQQWRCSLTHSPSYVYTTTKWLLLLLFLSVHYFKHRCFTTIFSTVCPRCMYTYKPFRAIEKYRPQGYINPICRHSHGSVSTDSTIVRVLNWFDYLATTKSDNQLDISALARCCHPITSLFRLFLVIDNRLFLNRIVSSSSTE